MNLVFLCVGTPKIIGDSIGPKLGDVLRQKNVKAFVYGTTTRPVTSVNVDQYYDLIQRKHQNDLVIAIDSALGSSEDIGRIIINQNGIRPGGAFNKSMNRIGDIGILAIVGDSSRNRYLELEEVSDAFADQVVVKLECLLEGIVSN